MAHATMVFAWIALAVMIVAVFCLAWLRVGELITSLIEDATRWRRITHGRMTHRMFALSFSLTDYDQCAIYADGEFVQSGTIDECLDAIEGHQ